MYSQVSSRRGDSGGDRTRNLTFRRRTLYPLSYTVMFLV